jgi:hypothetical protein
MIRIARRRLAFSLLLVAATPLVLSAMLASIAPLPTPQFHDEFSYLLAGDTFAHGRLTNPSHPFWKFFETFQVIQQPTYMSKYPPMQGLFLALGKVLSGEFIAGVWISTALACLAAWWALSAWMPRRWATIGALVIATHPLILNWNWSYWGGAPAMIGGCLLIGAVARINKRVNLSTGIALGLGIGILLNSRPFEGAVITILVIAAFVHRSRGRKSAVLAPASQTGAILACLVTLAIALLFTGYYNHRVTGRALQFPYMLYEQQYVATAPLIWLPPPPRTPTYNHPVLRDFFLGWELRSYQEQRTIRGLIRAVSEKWWSFATAYFGSPAMLVALLASILTLRRDRRLGSAACIGVLFMVAAFGGLRFFPHYTAPCAIVYFFILIQGLRHIRAGWRGGRVIFRGILALHLAATIYWCGSIVSQGALSPAFKRAGLIDAAKREHTEQLIFVRPLEDYYVHNDWVYNDADIDASNIVWARDMGDEANKALMDYYPDREVWIFQIGAAQLRAIRIR